jgi:hypothetical protein
LLVASSTQPEGSHGGVLVHQNPRTKDGSTSQGGHKQWFLERGQSASAFAYARFVTNSSDGGGFHGRYNYNFSQQVSHPTKGGMQRGL